MRIKKDSLLQVFFGGQGWCCYKALTIAAIRIVNENKKPSTPRPKNDSPNRFLNGLSNPPTKKLNKTKKTRYCKSFFGGQGWIRTTEVVDGRFTVCSLWPLGNLPIFNLQKNGAGGRTRTPDLLITNQLLYQLSYTSVSTLEYNIITI